MNVWRRRREERRKGGRRRQKDRECKWRQKLNVSGKEHSETQREKTENSREK